MNNMAMQKLVNLYQLVDVQSFGNIESAPKFAKEWEEQTGIPRHLGQEQLNKMKNPFYNSQKDSVSLPPSQMRHYLEKYSQSITQAQKFYIDGRGGNILSQNEIRAVLHEVDFYCPYPETFLQFETDELIIQLLAKEREATDQKYLDTEQQQIDGQKITFVLNIYEKATKKLILDGNFNTLQFHKNNAGSWLKNEDGIGAHGYTYWVEDSVWKQLVDLSTDENNQYANPSLNTWAQYIDMYWTLFMIYLKYPQIAKRKDVSGRKPIWHDIPMRHFKNSAYREKPQYEHIELEISMYDDSSSNINGVNSTGRSAGTRFHSVRKHPRRLPNGKMTWVKAHFRGSKEEGIIFKDYKVER